MLSPELQIKHGGEFRRCLIEMDTPGMRKLWEHCAPQLTRMNPAETMIAMHMARSEMKYIPQRLRIYSRQWLRGEGIAKIDGQWVFGLPKPTATADAVGISSRSRDPRLSRNIMHAMRDALLDSFAKGITEAPIQKENMLKARARVRFKGRHI